MPSYRAPLEDIRFVFQELWNIEAELKKIPCFAEITTDVINPVLEEAAKINEHVLLPLNAKGDKEGCRFQDGKVFTPEGFKNAYRLYCEGGWTALTADPTYSGQGFPHVVGMMIEEMLCASNVSFSLYVGLTQGVAGAINKHANAQLKQTYLPNMASGRWTGAMCLTEPQAGSDLGLVRTKAEKTTEGNYLINGTKIFITCGEHDLAENIIHIVLARTPDAPAGIKGISLFLVPKFLVNTDGSLGKFNNIRCGSIEHKMGVKASSTCVINYENAVGYLVGELNQGISCMFTVMNKERLSIGVQGLGLAEIAYQNARNYARDRLQGRALDGVKFPDRPADPILVHPDVRRMLLTVKAYNEGTRAFMAWVALLIDREHLTDATSARSQALVELFTPVVKAFFSDYGFEACNLALQVFGGHGYICEWGMEQFVRDARIAQLYEGTNGIQAMDLIRRKLVANQGEALQYFIEEVSTFIKSNQAQSNLKEYLVALNDALERLQNTSEWIIAQAKQDPLSMGAVATDYLRFLALVTIAYMWAKTVSVANNKLAHDTNGFYAAKLATAQFYFAKLLPQIDSLEKTIKAGSTTLMNLKAESF